MEKLKRRSLALVVFIFMLTIVILSFNSEVKAEDNNVEYTLEDIIEQTIDNNRDFKAEEYQLKQNQALYRQAEAGREWRSDLLADFSYQKTPDLLDSAYTLAGDDELDDTYWFSTATVAFSRILFDSIENQADLKRTEVLVKESEEELLQEELDLTIEILESSYDLFEAQDGVDLAESALKQRENELDRKKREKEEDKAVDTDVQEARVEVSEAESTLREAEDLLKLAENNLAQASGIENLASDNIKRPDLKAAEIDDEASPWPWDLERMQEIALEQRPEIKRSELGKEVAEIDLSTAEAEERPDLSLSSSYFLADQDVRLGLELDEEYRLLTTVSRVDSSLPELESFDFDEEFWEEVLDELDLDEGDFLSDDFDDSNLEAQSVENQNGSDGIPQGVSEDDTWQISFNLSYNIFDSGLTEQKINENEYKLEEAEETYQNAREQIELDVEQNYQELKTAYQEVRDLKLEYELTKQRHDEMEVLLAEDMGSEREKELLELLVLRTENDLKSALYDYELKKSKLASTLGFRYDWMLDYLTIE